MITLLSPEVIVIGGGVSLIGQERFFNPVRRAVGQYVFPPVANQFEIVSAALGEEVVVYGALALAHNAVG
jgi:glucokinase